MDHPEDMTPTERGAVILERLRDGRRMTTAAIAQELGVSRQWAHYMMEYRIARSIPRVARDEQTGEYFYSDDF
jgi:predicted DNA-binding transcriptional regulator YafY